MISVQFNNLFKLKQLHTMYILYLIGDNNHYIRYEIYNMLSLLKVNRETIELTV